jgi:hypothetical protein
MLTKQKSRPLCSHCKIVPAKSNGISKLGFKKWHKYCGDCSKMLYSEQHKYLQTKGMRCEFCNFKAQDKCQMDVVFKDGNKKNKKQSNLKTLCANCGRLYQKQLKRGRKGIMSVTVDADDIRIS